MEEINQLPKTQDVREAVVSQQTENVEEKILKAAQTEFIQYGFKGARMQQIADRAQVNKALLHYYYRSKEKLYGAVLEGILGKIRAIMEKKFTQSPPKSLEQVIRSIVSAYLQVFSRNPEFPLFLAQELNRSSKPAFQVMGSFTTFIQYMKAHLVNLLEQEEKAGNIKPVPIQHLMLNLMGMTMGTFFLKPLTQVVGPGLGVRFEYDEKFYRERLEAIVNMAMYGLRFKDSGDRDGRA
jgi:AcrR family transcriptional regulator